MAKVQITETILRDAQQSLIGTRMTIDDMIPLLELLDKVGYYSVDAWGGDTFDTCLRQLEEDPWERLRTIKKHMPKTKLQMLFQGQSLLGHRHFADDVVDYFVRKAIDNGIEILRIYDPLNDVRNLEASIRAVKSCSALVQGAICYTESSVHTTEYYIRYARQLEDAGVDSICLIDAAGLLNPFKAYELVAAIKDEVKVPLQLNTHCTTGFGSMSAFKAIEAGLDMIDTAISPMALGWSQPPTESIVAAMEKTSYDTGLRLERLAEVREAAAKLRDQYLSNGLLDPAIYTVNMDVMINKLPGELLEGLKEQLRNDNNEGILSRVLEEIPKVRKDAGMPPMVPPISQVIGTQAVLNILSEESYLTVTKEFRSLIRGEYGSTPVKVDAELSRRIIGEDSPVTVRSADLLPPELDRFRRELPLELVEQEEDVLTYAQFEDMAIGFFERRRDNKYGVDTKIADHSKRIHPV